MNYDFVPFHGGPQSRQILYVITKDLESGISAMARKMPFPTGGEVVINGHTTDLRIGQKPVHKMASDEAGASHDKESAIPHADPHSPERAASANRQLSGRDRFGLRLIELQHVAKMVLCLRWQTLKIKWPP